MSQAQDVLGDTHVILNDDEGNLYELSQSTIEESKVSDARKDELQKLSESGEVAGFGNFNLSPTSGSPGYGGLTVWSGGWRPTPRRH
jgi:hypothetical protein